MNDNLIEIELHARALEFIKESLANATGVATWLPQQQELADGSTVAASVPTDVHEDTLANHLLKRQDLMEGTIVTCVPRSVPHEALYRFREGVTLKAALNTTSEPEERAQEPRPVPMRGTLPWLSGMVQEYLRGGPDRMCIFEDSMASPGDGWIAKSELKPHIFKNVVYFALLSRDAENNEKVESTIVHAHDVWLFYGVMSSLPADSRLDPEGGTITREVMEMLAQRTEKIVVGAYDGESYLIWSKPTL